jgi:hypothetical protein
MARQLADPDRAGLQGLNVVYFTVLGERALPDSARVADSVNWAYCPELVLADALAVAASGTTIEAAKTVRTILRGNDFFMPQVTQTERRLWSKSGRTVQK